MSDKECGAECVVGEVYLTIGDGGTKIRVLDCGHGPQIEVQTSSFGNGVNTFELYTTHAGIVALAKMFQAAAEKDFSQPYRYSAYPLDLTPKSDMQEVNCCQAYVLEPAFGLRDCEITEIANNVLEKCCQDRQAVQETLDVISRNCCKAAPGGDA